MHIGYYITRYVQDDFFAFTFENKGIPFISINRREMELVGYKKNTIYYLKLLTVTC